MATKIRLTRLGKKKQPTYRVVVIDSRKPRDGKYIEQLGFYDPRQSPSLIQIDNERALHWLNTGAQPTERAQKLLEISGAWTQFKVAKGEIHTVGDVKVEEADKVEEAANVEETTEEVIEEAVEEAVEEVAVPVTEDVAQPAAEEAVEEAADEAEIADESENS
jgi:small subunit ribosomal protein S16